MEFNRILSGQLIELSKQFRVVTLLGPRQAGKTTLTKMAFPNYRYVSLENPENRNLAISDPRSFLQQNPPPVIFDEIQRVPELLSWVQEIVDARPDQRGQFILTGSHQPLLQNTISQSLAGRTALLTLLPLSIVEVLAKMTPPRSDSASDWIHRGFLPEIYRANMDPISTYRAYLQTYVERDVRQIINLKDVLVFERFLRLLAARVGQLVNMNSLASDVGVSSKTIGEWISVLEASFIVFRLTPYFENFGKRVVKAPKLFFTDVGLASYLLNLESAQAIERNSLYGNLFENLVVAELLKSRLNQGRESELYFYRDSHGREVDLLWRSAEKLTPIEIKSSQTYHVEYLKNLTFFSSLTQSKKSGFLIYSGISRRINEQFTALNFLQATDALVL